MAKLLTKKEKIGLILNLSRLRSSEGNLSFLRQSIEMVILRTVHGIGPEYYHTAGFWRKNIRWTDKRDHLGARQYNKRLRDLNPESYRKISQNKLAEKSMLTLFNIPSTRYLGYFHPSNGLSINGNALRTEVDLVNYLQTENISRYCFKPVEGWAGHGVCALEVSAGAGALMVCDLKTDKVTSFQDFYSQHLSSGINQGWIIEEFMEQHTAMAQFHPKSLNTLRIWASRSQESESKAMCGYLRMGRGGSIVDNQSSGGIVAPVENTSGVLSAAIDGLPSHEIYTHHPDTHARIEGAVIPMWSEAKALAEQALNIFPEIHFAGLDIAVTPSGPVVVELNVSPDKEGAAFMGLPAARYL